MKSQIAAPAARPWFGTEQRVAALWSAARRWEGTPFRLHCASRSGGVDCVRLIHALFCEVGAIGPLELPAYHLDHARHSAFAQLTDFLARCPDLAPRLQPVDLAAVLPGDLLLCRLGRVEHHLAVALPWGKCIHAVEIRGVLIHDRSEPAFARRLTAALRLTETPAPCSLPPAA